MGSKPEIQATKIATAIPPIPTSTQIAPLIHAKTLVILLRSYAEIADFARRRGRTLSDNDVWIAATAAATDARLVTTDKDFDPLDPEFLKRTWIDPRGPKG